MGAVPKKRLSKSRRDRRRAQDRLSPYALVQCPQCGEMRRPHRLCPHCLTYRGRQVLPAPEE